MLILKDYIFIHLTFYILKLTFHHNKILIWQVCIIFYAVLNLISFKTSLVLNKSILIFYVLFIKYEE